MIWHAEAGLDCSTCGLRFKHHHTLRRHLVHVHGIAVQQGPPLKISRDTIEGRPICRHCGVAFISWQNMRHHISSLSCPALELTKAPPVVLTQHRRRLLDIYDTGDLQLLREDGMLTTFLTHRCILCGYWAAKTQQMSAHMSREHQDAAHLTHEVMPHHAQHHTCPDVLTVSVLPPRVQVEDAYMSCDETAGPCFGGSKTSRSSSGHSTPQSIDLYPGVIPVQTHTLFK